MRILKFTGIMLLLFSLTTSIKSFSQVEEKATLAPETTITVEQARTNRDRFLANTNIDHSAFTYDYEELKKFIDFVESQKSKGVDVKYITVYLSQYENGDKTAFIAPLKNDGTPNYDLRVLNHGSVIPPKTGNGKSNEEVRY